MSMISSSRGVASFWCFIHIHCHATNCHGSNIDIKLSNHREVWLTQLSLWQSQVCALCLLTKPINGHFGCILFSYHLIQSSCSLLFVQKSIVEYVRRMRRHPFDDDWKIVWLEGEAPLPQAMHFFPSRWQILDLTFSRDSLSPVSDWVYAFLLASLYYSASF